MADKKNAEGMLSPYRVLDLTDEKGPLCGKLLGDLGADVIKIERPGGDPARSLGPFYHDEIDPEKSLFWFAYNASKRGITLDIETARGQEIFKRLVKDADFVVESFSPGYMDKLGLGYSALERLNSRVIMVSISPFGQTGPYKDYKGPDIVAWAMGGFMHYFGDADRPPVRVGHHSQSHLEASIEGAVGAMMALYDLQVTGEGQQVDVSIQESVARGSATAGRGTARGQEGTAAVRTRHTWPCKDGDILWFYTSGPQAVRQSRPIIEWMESEGVADDFLTGIDWDKFDFREVTQEMIDRINATTGEFFMERTKAELFDGAVQRRIRLYPVATTADILSNPQLAAREFWTEVNHPELDASIIYPGAFANASETPPRISRRAPLIGEHNREIYEKELGISGEQLATLKQDKVI